MRLLSSLGNGGRLLSLGLVLSSLGLADTILFQRALPTGSNVNATSNRSNVDWINPTDNSNNFFINGDTFTVPNGQQWQISSIAVFIVLNKTNDTPGAEFSNFSLYLASDTGDDGDGMDLTDNDEAAQNFSVVSTTPTPTLQTISTASACNGNNIYLASDGVTSLPVYMMSFATSLTLPAGTYDFAAN